MEATTSTDPLQQLPANVIPLVVRRVPKLDWPFLRLVSKFWKEAVDCEITALVPRRWNLSIARRFPKLRRLDLENSFTQNKAEDMLHILAELPDLHAVVRWQMPTQTHLGSMASHFTQLEEIGFACCKKIYDFCNLHVLRHTPNLNVLKLDECDFYFQELIEEVQNLGRLSSLELSECSLLVPHAMMVPQSQTWDDVVPQLPARHLKILRMPATGCAHGPEFYPNLARFTGLTELDISSADHADEGVDVLNALTNLTYLSIARTEISSQGARQLTALTGLQSLDAHDCLWTSPHASKIALQNFPSLHTLDLSGCAQLRSNGGFSQLHHLTCLKVTDCGKFGSFQEISSLHELVELHAGGSTINDNAIQSFSGLTLRCLDMSHDKPSTVTDAGIAHLGRISDLTGLEELSLAGMSNITDNSLHSLRALSKLTKLDLSMCVHVTSAGLHELESLPLEWLRCRVCEGVIEEDLPTKLKLALWRGHRGCAWCDS